MKSLNVQGYAVNASERIIEEFDRLIKLGRAKISSRPYAEQVLFLVVVSRCEADMAGFSSVFNQALTHSELRILIDGFRQLGKEKLALEFERGLNALEKEGFYKHLNWNKVQQSTRDLIEEIGDRVGSELWDLDEKLVELLDGRK